MIQGHERVSHGDNLHIWIRRGRGSWNGMSCTYLGEGDRHERRLEDKRRHCDHRSCSW